MGSPGRVHWWSHDYWAVHEGAPRMSEAVDRTQLHCELNLIIEIPLLYYKITQVFITLSDLLGAKIWLPSFPCEDWCLWVWKAPWSGWQPRRYPATEKLVLAGWQLSSGPIPATTNHITVASLSWLRERRVTQEGVFWLVDCVWENASCFADGRWQGSGQAKRTA